MSPSSVHQEMEGEPIKCACCGKPIMADQPERASDGELVHEACEEEYETIVYLREFEDGA